MDQPMSATIGRMGRPPLFKVKMVATVIRLPKELLERIKALVGEKGMAAFIREAVERELTRRERKAKN